MSILGYFTLAIKALEIDSASVSKTMEKRKSRFALYDGLNRSYTAAAYLLAQFGKNYAIDNGNRINGMMLMNEVMKVVRDIQYRIGGGLIYLDVEKSNRAAISLYSDKIHFSKFDERKSSVDDVEYDVMIKAI